MNDITIKKELSVDINETDGSKLKNNLNLMQANGQIIKDALQEGIDKDYALIPGTNKVSLLQPGADKIMLLYNLAIDYEIIEKEHINDFGWRLFIKATLTVKGSGMFVSNAYSGFDPTGNRSDKQNGMKLDTALKVCQKRAKVWAVKSIGGLSDIFNDDLTDFAKDMSCISSTQVKDIFKIFFDWSGGIRDNVQSDINTAIVEWNKVKDIKISTVSKIEKDIYEEFLNFSKELYKK